jgi:hypothetical protein
MPAELVRAGLRLGLLIILMAAATLPFLQPSSAEFWATIAALVVGSIFIGGLLLIWRVTSHQSPPWKG